MSTRYQFMISTSITNGFAHIIDKTVFEKTKYVKK